VFPQFATHNAQTLSGHLPSGGQNFTVGDYEFQCLHGMGEPLYDEVVGAEKLNRPCRIYAPVGTHETLLAYLVRRLLENGANSSFVNRIADPEVSIADLIADPVEAVRAMAAPGQKNPQIALPQDLYGARRNSAGLDLSNETTLAMLSETMAGEGPWDAAPSSAQCPRGTEPRRSPRPRRYGARGVGRAGAGRRPRRAGRRAWLGRDHPGRTRRDAWIAPPT
jgi:RHH-type transcriptional regulator, proline utilization regulon repressor / proline dehydrogenase / delta 1-pyrroline-5-carboxylate dehydrogenase